MSYDSTRDTREHITKVQANLLRIAADLTRRAKHHDESKLAEPEKSVFDTYTPKLAGSTYGSDEYKTYLAGMGEGLKHHYAVNDHHPEHGDGTLGWMNLMQLIEMLCDWKAATERHADGDLGESIRKNAERFGYTTEFERLLARTAADLGWL